MEEAVASPTTHTYPSNEVELDVELDVLEDVDELVELEVDELVEELVLLEVLLEVELEVELDVLLDVDELVELEVELDVDELVLLEVELDVLELVEELVLELELEVEELVLLLVDELVLELVEELVLELELEVLLEVEELVEELELEVELEVELLVDELVLLDVDELVLELVLELVVLLDEYQLALAVACTLEPVILKKARSMLSVLPLDIYNGIVTGTGNLAKVVCSATLYLLVPLPIQNSILSLCHLISNDVGVLVQSEFQVTVVESGVPDSSPYDLQNRLVPLIKKYAAFRFPYALEYIPITRESPLAGAVGMVTLNSNLPYMYVSSVFAVVLLNLIFPLMALGRLAVDAFQ